MNRATLIGYVGKDPEVRTVSGGKKVANFSLATSERWKDRETGERKEVTEWHRVIVWGDGLVGVIEKYVRKGSQIYVEGALRTRKWTDQSGAEKYSTEIVVQGHGGRIQLLGSRNGTDASNEPDEAPPPARGEPKYDRTLDDEIPF